MRESGAVWVSHGGELGVGEADGAVGDGERRDFDVCDGDLGISWSEDGEVNCNRGYDSEYDEDGGDGA